VLIHLDAKGERYLRTAKAAKPAKPPDRPKRLLAYDGTRFAVAGLVCAQVTRRRLTRWRHTLCPGHAKCTSATRRRPTSTTSLIRNTYRLLDENLDLEEGPTCSNCSTSPLHVDWSHGYGLEDAMSNHKRAASPAVTGV
jgi:hypothetical protein